MSADSLRPASSWLAQWHTIRASEIVCQIGGLLTNVARCWNFQSGPTSAQTPSGRDGIAIEVPPNRIVRLPAISLILLGSNRWRRWSSLLNKPVKTSESTISGGSPVNFLVRNHLRTPYRQVKVVSGTVNTMH